jgi:beta-lactamase regulating signal transducer with metallopeptidase domain
VSELLCSLGGWLATYAIHSTLLLGTVAVLDWSKRIRSVGTLEFLWKLAMFGGLFTATFQMTGNFFAMDGSSWFRSWQASLISISPPNSVASPDASSAMQWSDATAKSTLFTLASPGFLARGAIIVAVVWLVGSILASCKLIGLLVCSQRVLANRWPATQSLNESMQRLSMQANVRAPKLSVSDQLNVPISLATCEVVVPTWVCDELTLEQCEVVLAHELAHQVRCDPYWLWLMQWMCSFGWFQPLNSIARHRLVCLAELSADAWAARTGVRRRALAECLLLCGERILGTQQVSFALSLSSGGPLVDRVDRLLTNSSLESNQVQWPIRLVAIVGLILTTLWMPGCDVDSSMLPRKGERISISTTGANENNVEIRRGGYQVRLSHHGKVVLSDDVSSIVAIAPSGDFQLQETQEGVRRGYGLRSDREGKLTETYTLNGRTIAADDAARQWLSTTLHRTVRDSGLQLDDRIEAMIRNSGVEHVLQEASEAQGEFAKCLILTKLLEHSSLSDGQANAFRSIATAIQSEHERKKLEGLLLASNAGKRPK